MQFRHRSIQNAYFVNDLDEAVDPRDPALVSLKNMILCRVADIEVSLAETALSAPSSPTPEC